MSNIGTLVSLPLFHHFDINDNIIILVSSVSGILSRLIKAFAKTESVFYASTFFGIFLYVGFTPIRAQITRCVESEELGKVGFMINLLNCSYT